MYQSLKKAKTSLSNAYKSTPIKEWQLMKWKIILWWTSNQDLKLPKTRPNLVWEIPWLERVLYRWKIVINSMSKSSIIVQKNSRITTKYSISPKETHFVTLTKNTKSFEIANKKTKKNTKTILKDSEKALSTVKTPIEICKIASWSIEKIVIKVWTSKLLLRLIESSLTTTTQL